MSNYKYKVEIGELRTRVTLLTPSLDTDAGGAQKPVHSAGNTVWANVKYPFGLELIQAQAAKAEAPLTVIIRYRSDVTAAWGVRLGSTDYQLTAPPNDIENRHEYLEIKAVTIKGTM